MRSNFTDNPQSLVSFLFFSFFLNVVLSFSVCFFFVVLWSRFFFFSRIFAVKKEAADGRRRLGPRSTSAYRGCWWNATGPGTLCWPRRMSGTWNTPTGPAPSAQHRNGINDSLSLSLSLSSFFIFPFQRSFARHLSKKQNKRRTPDYEDDREGHTRRHWPLRPDRSRTRLAFQRRHRSFDDFFIFPYCSRTALPPLGILDSIPMFVCCFFFIFLNRIKYFKFFHFQVGPRVEVFSNHLLDLFNSP